MISSARLLASAASGRSCASLGRSKSAITESWVQPTLTPTALRQRLGKEWAAKVPGDQNSGLRTLEPKKEAACPVPKKKPRSQASCPPESATNLLRAALKALKSPFCRYRSILPLRLWGLRNLLSTPRPSPRESVNSETKHDDKEVIIETHGHDNDIQ